MKALAAENKKREKKNKRRCPKCLKIKKLDAFGYRNIMAKDGYVKRIQTWCQQCRREAARLSVKKNKDSM
mgnify:CR=1 FL=1